MGGGLGWCPPPGGRAPRETRHSSRPHLAVGFPSNSRFQEFFCLAPSPRVLRIA
jgi:hypothetical protein